MADDVDSSKENEVINEEAEDLNPQVNSEAEGAQEDNENVSSDLPKYAKSRLKRQEKKHRRELDSHRRIIEELKGELENKPHFDPSLEVDGDVNDSGNALVSQVRKALAQERSEKEERDLRAQEEVHRSHVAKHYQRFEENLDKASEKYDDFDDVVRGEDLPITETIRDVAMLLPNSADVLYKLGKNRDDLERISKLSPIEQSKEVINLAFALSSIEKGVSQDRESSPMKSLMGGTGKISKDNSNLSVSDLRKMLRKNK